jgi:hypothetical protein
VDINIGKGRLQGEGRSRLESSAVLVLVPEPGQNIHLPLSKKKQVGFEIVGFSC